MRTKRPSKYHKNGQVLPKRKTFLVAICFLFRVSTKIDKYSLDKRYSLTILSRMNFNTLFMLISSIMSQKRSTTSCIVFSQTPWNSAKTTTTTKYVMQAQANAVECVNEHWVSLEPYCKILECMAFRPTVYRAAQPGNMFHWCSSGSIVCTHPV